jgi:hypothetical protein
VISTNYHWQSLAGQRLHTNCCVHSLFSSDGYQRVSPVRNQAKLLFCTVGSHSLSFLRTQNGFQTLHIARNDSQRDVSFEAVNAMVRAHIQTMLFERIDPNCG